MGVKLFEVRRRRKYFRPVARSPVKRTVLRIVSIICAIAFFSGAGAGAGTSYIFTGSGDSGRFLWKSVPRAQCKLDDKTPLTWNIYQTEKKKDANLVLVLLGRRYLALDIKGKVAYYVFPSDLQAKGQDFESGSLFVQSRVLPTSGWTVRDVGPAELIKLTLGDYGHALDVELPHMPDLRAFY
jgi:hypothetical protein